MHESGNAQYLKIEGDGRSHPSGDAVGHSASFPARYREPASALDFFVRTVEEGNVGAAAGLLSASILQCVSPSRMEQILYESSVDIASAGGIEAVDVQTIAVSDRHAELKLSIWYCDHRLETERVEMEREDGQWKVDFAEGRAAESSP